MSHFVEVVLPFPVAKTFTYLVSEAEYKFIQNGMRIAVPFGKSKIYTALAVDKHQNPPQLYQAKEIHQIIDEKPVVNHIQLEHWKWIASYYMCSLGEVFKSAMPNGYILESETIISSNQTSDWKNLSLDDDAYLLLEALTTQSSLTIDDVTKILGKKTVLPVIYKLLQKGNLVLHHEVKEQYKPKLVKYVRLHAKFNEKEALEACLQNLSKFPKQRDLMLYYFKMASVTKTPIPVSRLIEESGISIAVLKGVVAKEILELFTIHEDRVSFEGQKRITFQLSKAQNQALQEIKHSFNHKDCVLFHGVTASGKTEVYCKLIEDFILNGKQVLFLLPEIALTTQLVQRLVGYFGNKVSVYHSKYSDNERIEVWNNVLQDLPKAQIVIGVRSALFLPFSNLGLIVIDEEHEATFKQQDPSPRYHARDAAIILAKQHHAKVILGSATPSLESYYNVYAQKYELVTLQERFSNVVVPEIKLIDLKDKYFRKKMTGHFSDELLEAMAQSLALGEQIIIFQNRRGFAPYVECTTCGHVPHCPHCDVSLTYYKYKNALRCHYCGYAMANPSHCHSCQSVDLTTKGFGTEQIELELKALFPEKKIGRMDQDTTRGKFGYEKIIDAFKNREIDILVGTQMLAKGLDFDNVTLVGVLNADNLLNQPDFRAYERAYQLLTQVSGRAGRATKSGVVLIQTYNPFHNTITQVVRGDYSGMYKEQIYQRQIYKYPPFYRLIRLTMKHRDYDKLKEASLWMHNVLSQSLDIPILGPEEPVVNRIRNEYIRTILVKIPSDKSLGNTKKTIQKIMNSFESISPYRAIRVTINVDNY